MVNKPFGGLQHMASRYILLIGNVLVGQAGTGGIIKFDYGTEDFDTSLDQDGDGVGDKYFKVK